MIESPARFAVAFRLFIGKRFVFLSVLLSAILFCSFAFAESERAEGHHNRKHKTTSSSTTSATTPSSSSTTPSPTSTTPPPSVTTPAPSPSVTPAGSPGAIRPVKLEVFAPPSSPPSWLVNSHLVSGATFFVKWSTVEPMAGSYDFTSTDKRFAPWIAAGLKVNIVFEAVALSAPNSVTPSWLMLELGLDQTANCSSDVIPNYFSSTFQNRYQQVMAAVVDHYRGNPSIGYVRFGLGRGGETHPAPTSAFNNTSGSCYQKLVSLGWTKTSWVDYIGKMLAYERTLGATFPLLVTASNELGDVSISDAIANEAAPLGFGLGYQGFSTNDISKYNAGQRCQNDWCALWNTYAGQVELENQLGRAGSISSPAGGGNGSLVQLLAFAQARHVTIFEQNFQDWRTAFDPTSPLYAIYHVAYAAAMHAASQ